MDEVVAAVRLRSNVPVDFRVTGHAKGSWEVAAGERTTVSIGEAPWSGATYVVHAGPDSFVLKVEPFTATTRCHAPWQLRTWYNRTAQVSYDGWNYSARIGHIAIRPDLDLGLVWEREGRCGGG